MRASQLSTERGMKFFVIQKTLAQLIRDASLHLADQLAGS